MTPIKTIELSHFINSIQKGIYDELFTLPFLGRTSLIKNAYAYKKDSLTSDDVSEIIVSAKEMAAVTAYVFFKCNFIAKTETGECKLTHDGKLALREMIREDRFK